MSDERQGQEFSMGDGRDDAAWAAALGLTGLDLSGTEYAEAGSDTADHDLAARIAAKLRDVPDFPQPGVLFKDITPLLADSSTFGASIDALAEIPAAFGSDIIAGVEARGFLVAAALARAVDAGVVPVRKAGKLPPPTVTASYALEYGTAEIEIPTGLLDGQTVFVVDDVLATGGTLAASIGLLEQAGALVTGAAVLVELSFLNGRRRITDFDVHALLTL